MTEKQQCNTCHYWDNVSWSEESAPCLARVPEWAIKGFSDFTITNKVGPRDGTNCPCWKKRNLIQIQKDRGIKAGKVSDDVLDVMTGKRICYE